MSYLWSSRTQALHRYLNLIRVLAPDEGLRRLTGDREGLFDGHRKLANVAINTATDLFLCQGCKPALDQTDPERAGGPEVHMKAQAPGESTVDQCRLKRAVIVRNRTNA